MAAQSAGQMVCGGRPYDLFMDSNCPPKGQELDGLGGRGNANVLREVAGQREGKYTLQTTNTS